MSINFLNLSNRYKNTAISLSIAGLVLQSCTNYESKRNMEDSEINTERTNYKKTNTQNTSNCCKYLAIGTVSFVLGGISGGVGIPIMNNQLNSTKDQLNQVSSSLKNTQSQAALLAQPITAIFADNVNATYTLANGTTIYGNSSSVYDLSYNDILGITGISTESTERPYTAEQEFSLIGLTQVVPSLPNLQSVEFNGQYISDLVNFTATQLRYIDLTNSYVNAPIILPNEISEIVLTNTILCSDGLLICEDGATDSPNCNNQTINSEFIELNTNIIFGNPTCTNYTEYQQVLTSFNALNNTFTTLETVLSGTGAMTLADTLTNYNTLQGNFNNLNNTLFSCNGANCATAYNICSNNGQYPNASTQLNQSTTVANCLASTEIYCYQASSLTNGYYAAQTCGIYGNGHMPLGTYCNNTNQ